MPHNVFGCGVESLLTLKPTTQMENNNEQKQLLWEVKSSTSSIADTGDYYTQYWLENKNTPFKFFLSSDNEDDYIKTAEYLNQFTQPKQQDSAGVQKIGDGRIIFDGETYINEKSKRVAQHPEPKEQIGGGHWKTFQTKTDDDVDEIGIENLYHKLYYGNPANITISELQSICDILNSYQVKQQITDASIESDFQLLYKKLNSLAIEVDGSIVSNIKETVNKIYKAALSNSAEVLPDNRYVKEKDVESYNGITKEEMWRKWQSDKNILGIYMDAVAHYGVKNFSDVKAVADLQRENNQQ